ncbi:acyl-CoA dehydrogenase family protein [Castellaniella sp. GW247-6E4]|uniref:acyl-CoA dehydrogenase family protein n=1 Tax=Castellaniella sp. GW247-6E4 TaxID=3140380 RepID=UPI0033158583
MDVAFDQENFRRDVREFLRRNLPEDLRAKVIHGRCLAKGDFVRWQRILHQAGWGAVWWPIEYGGAGWDPLRCHLFEEECALAGAPVQIAFGLRMLAPVLIAFGSEVQKSRFLPGIISGEDWWCQGYSEPGSGSDLASLKTRAVRSGQEYIVDGQKTWTTYAQHADWMFCLARTRSEGKPQEGISFLLIDMKAPGIMVRPIITMDGEHEINEVWLENVRVPAENLVGEENKGWSYAKFLLGHERTAIADIGSLKRELRRLKNLVINERALTGAVIDDVRFRDRVAWLELNAIALEATCLRLLSVARERQPGPEASLLKIRSTELQQAIAEAQLLALGVHGLPDLRPVEASDANEETADQNTLPESVRWLAARYFNLRKTTIYGGTTEIQKNLIAQVMGL